MVERTTCGLCPNDCELNALLCPRGDIWLKKEAENSQEKEKDGE